MKTAEIFGDYRGPFQPYTNVQAFTSQRLRVIQNTGGPALRIKLGSPPRVRHDSMYRYGPVDTYLLKQFDNFGLKADIHYTLDVPNRNRKFLPLYGRTRRSLVD